MREDERWIGAPPFEPGPKREKPKLKEPKRRRHVPAEQCREYQCLGEESKLKLDRSLFAIVVAVHGPTKARDLDAGAFHDLAARVYHEVLDLGEV